MARFNLRNGIAYAMVSALMVPMLAACGGAAPAGTAATAAPAAAATAAPAMAATAAPAATAAMAEATAAPAATAGTAATAAPAAKSTAAPAVPASLGSAEAGVLRLNHGAEGENYDPQQASFVGEIQFIQLNYQGLMTFDKDAKPIPGQAETVTASADGKTYTFKLRAGSKYSDGTPLTAKNYEFGWKRLADPELAGQYQSIACGIIVGYSEYSAATCPDAQGNTKTITDVQKLDLAALRDKVGVKAIDDTTLEIKLVNPAPFFLSMAALWFGMPVREQDAQNVQGLVTAVPENYVGNGPFKLAEHSQGQIARFEVNPNYVGPLGPVQLKEIRFAFIEDSQVAYQAYKNGELDINGVASEDLAAVKADATLSKELTNTPGSCTFYLGFNLRKPPFDNIKVRQAFAQAFDREAWVRDVFKGLGKPTQTFIPPGFPGYEATTKYAFDPAAAKKSLADSGVKVDEVKLTFSSSARNKVRFEWMANQIKTNLGVNVNLDPVDPTAYTALLKDETTIPEMFYLGWCADYPDPQDWLTTVFKTGGVSAGRAGFSNKDFDKITAQADIETDATKRAKLYSQAQSMLLDQSPVVFMNNDAIVLLTKPYVKGTDIVTPIDYIPGFFNLKNITVKP